MKNKNDNVICCDKEQIHTQYIYTKTTYDVIIQRHSANIHAYNCSLISHVTEVSLTRKNTGKLLPAVILT